MMLYQFIEIAVSGAAAILFAAGCLLLTKPAMTRFRMRLRVKERHSSRVKSLTRRGMEQDAGYLRGKLRGGIRRRLELMLKAVQGDKYKEGSVERFAMWWLSAGAVTFAFVWTASEDTRFAAAAGLLSMLIILSVLWLKERSIQIQAGYDLAEAVGVIVSKYKMTRGSMRLALRAAAPEITSPAIRRMIIHIVREELNYIEPIEMEKAVEELVYGIRTSFSKQLGLTILKGLLHGENVERTLLAIDKNIHKQIDLLRDEGDSSSEVLQLSWLHVILFPLLLGFMIAFMGVSSTLHYQFQTESGRFWLAVITACILGSLFMAVWFRKPVNDY